MSAPTSSPSSHTTTATAEKGTVVRAWPDWVNLVIAAYVLLAPLWTAAAPAGWFVTLGVLGGAAAVWALATSSSRASEWSMMVVGAVLFLAPWMGGFAVATGAAWTAWIAGAAMIVFAGVAMNQANDRM